MMYCEEIELLKSELKEKNKDLQKLAKAADSMMQLTNENNRLKDCLLYTSPSPRDGLLSRMPSSA